MDRHEEKQRFQPSCSGGLTQQQVRMREEQGLINVTQEKITKTNAQIILSNVLTLFNGFNFAIAICLGLVGAYTNMLYILGIVTNIFMGIVQEIHAKNMVEHLSLISQAMVTVVRDGKECEIPVEALVLDDITVLDMGVQICSDSIVASGEVEVNESLLTGEADAILKRPGDTLLSGSFVVSGKCYAKVEQVGADNFSAKLVQEAKKHKKVTSELLSSMRKITKFTSFFIVPLGIILFLEAYFLKSQGLKDAVVYTSAALLGMLPKGLVLLVTFALITGFIRLSQKNIIVQGLHSIETLAHVDMLCLDKTGTLTEGKMQVKHVYPMDEHALPISIDQAIGCYIGASDDNNATFLALKEHFQAVPSTDILGKVPFSSERKWGAVTLKLGTLVLGAPEKLLAGSALPREIAAAQASGNRILCLGYCKDPIAHGALPSVTLVAAIELSDPIRKSAKETLDFFKREGVSVKIISGDNPQTVSSIARQAGFENHQEYIDLSQIHSEQAITAAAQQYSIFGRVTPNQKKQLIQALKAMGHTVAMTGDGVNDVLALKEADCSIAMAAGSEAARQVAQLVLLNSDFSVLTNVVMEGRRVVNNSTRFGAIYIIKTIFSFLLSIIGAFTLTAYPFVPIQITMYDMIIEGYFTFLLSFERNIERIYGRFLRNVIQRASPYALLVVIYIYALRLLSSVLGFSSAEAVTAMFYITGTVGILAAVNACRPFTKLRAFVCSTTAFGFYLAAYLFSGLLQLVPLTRGSMAVFAGMVLLAPPILMLFEGMMNRLFERFWRS